MFAYINETPPHVTQLPGEFSPQIDLIIQQALAKSSSDRPGSAMAMAVALHTALTGDKTWAPQISSTPLSGTPGGSTTQKLSPEPRSAPPRPRWLRIVA